MPLKSGQKIKYISWRPKESRWRAQVVRRGKLHEEHFSMRKYGSREKALAAAILWRNELLRSLPRRIIKLKKCRNLPGTVGVVRACKTNPTGQQYRSWVAQWREKGHTRTRKFSILKYGEEEAHSRPQNSPEGD